MSEDDSIIKLAEDINYSNNFIDDYYEDKKINIVSKKCIHGSRSSYHCKECNGNAFCEHKIKKQYCFECRKPGECWCKINKYKCGFCRANEICKHGIKSARCLECRKVRTTICLLTDYQEGLYMYEKCDCNKCKKILKKGKTKNSLKNLNEEEKNSLKNLNEEEKNRFQIDRGNKLFKILFEAVKLQNTQTSIENNLHNCLSYLSSISKKIIYTRQNYFCENYKNEIKELINICKTQLSINYMLRLIWLLTNNNMESFNNLENSILLKSLLKKVLEEKNLDEQNIIIINYIINLCEKKNIFF